MKNLELLKEIQGWLSFNTKPSKEEIKSLRDDIKKHIEKQCDIPIVSESFSMEFAQYIAKEHYVLVNQIGKIHYWKNETSLRTSEQLLKAFKDSNG